MKQHIVYLAASAMMLTMAWLTGCDSNQAEPSSSTSASTTETTALAVSTVETTATDVSADADSEESGETKTIYYETYDDFLTGLGADFPGIVMVAPTQIAAGEWEVEYISLTSDDTAPAYTYQITDTDGNRITLTVNHMASYQYDSMDALLAALPDTVLEEYTGSRWAITDENGAYVLYGLTGDENLYYTLFAEDAAGTVLEPDTLAQLRETLRL